MNSSMASDGAVHVGVLAQPFIETNSGLEFLKHILAGLDHAFVPTGSRVTLFVPMASFKKSAFVEKATMTLMAVLCRWPNFNTAPFERLARGVNGLLPRLFPVDRSKLRGKFSEFVPRISLSFFYSLEQLRQELAERKVQVLLPLTASWGKKSALPWIGYVADCQHRYFPEYFANFELARRDRIISSLVNDAPAILVNAQSTKKDLVEFYGGQEDKIQALPFAPIADPSWFEEEPGALGKYRLPERYFLISNRFWVHKSHTTALEALAILKAQGRADLGLVCTGELQDYRDPRIHDILRNRVKSLGLTGQVEFLGLIDKREQIEIMKKAIAVLQPTLFEGGPGGGAVYNALALGKTAIVSDIPVNLELRGQDQVLFFEAKNADDLAEKMKMVMDRTVEAQAQSPERLALRSRLNLGRLGGKLREVVDRVVGRTET